MMGRSITLKSISSRLRKALDNEYYNDSERMKTLLEDVLSDIEIYSEHGIDFRAVADALDDSLVIADGEGRYIYSNPSYTRNTGIYPEMIIGRTAAEIEAEGKIFTHGAAIEVLKTKKKVFRLSTVHVSDSPELGFVAGVPIFDENGTLTHIAISSRPIFTLRALQDDFQQFLSEANSLENRPNNIPVREHDSADDLSSARLIGNSPALKNIWETIQRAAPTDATVLITGESGVGKEIVADEIYRLSDRNNKPFIKVNCASIPPNLLESELFGYEKGAFSGASPNGKQGLFESANGGTLLLDEIGDMPMDLQVKLLRAIQNKEITRVGGTRIIKLDIRFIAATNSDLRKKIAEGTFRQDLFYRLNVIPVHMPALRCRKDDIRVVCDHFIEMYNKKHGRHLCLTEKQYRFLENYPWPGNIRELENVIEYLVICASETNPELNDYMLLGILDQDADSNAELNMAMAMSTISSPAAPPVLSSEESLSDALEDYEISLIKSVLSESRSLREAGAKLGINASTLSRKIKQYGINYEKSR